MSQTGTKSNTNKHDFKVIIAGGSIAGLTLALMLEKCGIDFVILEAYKAIAPQAGASIALLPNGLRILDQLGCYQDMVAKAESVSVLSMRRSNMELVYNFENMDCRMRERFGYAAIFLDRRMVIEVLYNHIKDKSKILINHRVKSIENKPTGVAVFTESGETFNGDIVVGCDGVHSTVRKEIGRLGGRSLEDQIEASYYCIWGISTDVPNVPKGILNSTCGDQYSFFFADGPSNRSYCALLMRTDKKYKGDDIPKFEKSKEAEVAKKYQDTLILPGITYGDVYSRMVASIFTPLAEVVLDKWHHGRALLIGDSAHKFEPLTGQGGNNAIETCATFVNALNKALKTGNGKLATEELDSIFALTQATRQPRTSRLVKASHDQQNIEANKSPTTTFLATQYVKSLSEEDVMESLDETCLDAPSLDMVPLPQRPHQALWHDELLRPTESRGWVTLGLSAVYLAIAWLAAELLWGAGYSNGCFDLMDKIFASGYHEDGSPVLHHYTGIGIVDDFLGPIICFFYAPLSHGALSSESLVMMYLMLTVFALEPLIFVEANRRRSQWTLIASAVLWILVATIIGVGLVYNFFFLLHALLSHSRWHFVPTSRTVPKYIANNLLIGTLLGLGLPTIALFIVANPIVKQRLIFAWQFAAIFIVGTIKVLSVIGNQKSIPAKSGSKLTDISERYRDDLPGLSHLYKVMFFICAIGHFFIIGATLNTDMTLAETFLPFGAYNKVGSILEGAAVFTRADVITLTLGMFVWAGTVAYDLYRAGLSTLEPLHALGLIFAGFVVVGPGASVHALWFWREELMAKTTFGRV